MSNILPDSRLKEKKNTVVVDWPWINPQGIQEIIRFNRTGVYCIYNKINHKRYVGGAYKCLIRRLREHVYDLSKRRHHNRHLQFSWNKYGCNSFLFYILECCKPEQTQAREQHWIDEFDAVKTGYNIFPMARSAKGSKRTKAQRKRISEIKKGNQSCLGRKLSWKTKARIALGKRGSKASKAARKKMSIAHKGIKFSDEWRMNMSNAAKERELQGKRMDSVRTRFKKSRSRMGLTHSEETKVKMSLARTRYYENKRKKNVP